MGDKVFHITISRICGDFLRRAALDDPTAIHDCNAVAQLEGFVKIVAHEDDGALELGLQFEQFILQTRPDQRIEGGEGLIHEQDRRVSRKGAGQTDTLLHAA